MVVYKDKRYIIEKITPQSKYFSYSDLGAQFVIIDQKYSEGPFALLRKNTEGILMGSIISHVGLGEYRFDSYEHAVVSLSDAYDDYFRTCFGGDVCDEAEDETD